MDSRIVFSGTQDRSERRKVFVEVTLKQDVDGHKIPLSIKWKNGTVYNVDKLSDVRHFSPVPTETETRYTVLIGQRHTYLFEKDNRWYVEAKAYFFERKRVKKHLGKFK